MTCAHYLANYLATTLNWLFNILQAKNSYQPVVLTRATSNLDSFPMPKLYALEQQSALAQAYNLALYKTLGYFPLFYAAAKENGAELLHVHFGYDGYKMLALRRRLRLPMITGFFGIDASQYLRSKQWREHYQKLFDEGDLFLALGPQMLAALTDAGCPAEKVVIQNVGVDVTELPFRISTLDANQTVSIVMGASFREKKGIPYALQAAAILKKRALKFQLVIGGDGDLRPQIEAQIQTLGLQQHVKLLGYVPPLAFRKLIQQAHILVLPSITAANGDSEGTPLVLIEALAMGLPVVSTYHADIPQIVQDGVSGYLVPEKNAQLLAERLIHLIEHPEIWPAFGRAGRAHIAEHFNAKIQFEKLIRIYSALATSSHVSPSFITD